MQVAFGGRCGVHTRFHLGSCTPVSYRFGPDFQHDGASHRAWLGIWALPWEELDNGCSRKSMKCICRYVQKVKSLGPQAGICDWGSSHFGSTPSTTALAKSPDYLAMSQWPVRSSDVTDAASLYMPFATIVPMENAGFTMPWTTQSSESSSVKMPEGKEGHGRLPCQDTTKRGNEGYTWRYIG